MASNKVSEKFELGGYKERLNRSFNKKTIN